jgi:hypothetical protein
MAVIRRNIFSKEKGEVSISPSGGIIHDDFVATIGANGRFLLNFR